MKTASQMKEPVYREFKKNAEGVSAVVKRIFSQSDLTGYIDTLLREHPLVGRNAVIAAPQMKDEETRQLIYRVKAHGPVTVIRDHLADFNREIAIGITIADYGVAETGTLILKAEDLNLRLATMICRLHLAVLKQSNLERTFSDIAPLLQESLAESPSYLTFITGASRTADIERILILGVHGPLELHILVLEN